MVDVEAYQTEGSEDFNEFSCGECGTYHDTEEEAERCCEEVEEIQRKSPAEEEAKEIADILKEEERRQKIADDIEKYHQDRRRNHN